MSWIFTPYAGILWGTAAISLVVTHLLSLRRTGTGVKALIWLMIAVAEWSFASGMEAASIVIEQKIFWSKMEYIGAVTAPVLFFMFALSYSQKTSWLKPRGIIPLFIMPVIAFIATLTNEYHHLIWGPITPSPTVPNAVIYGHAVGYYILIFYDYLLLMAGFLILLRTWSHATSLQRREISILLVGSVFPLLAGILYSLNWNPLPALDITPVSFMMTGAILTIGLFRRHLFDLIPIARDTLVENIHDGVLVLDEKNRIVDINPVAEKFFALSLQDVIGQPAETMLDFWPDIEKYFQNRRASQCEILLQKKSLRYLDLHITPLYKRREQSPGWLLVFRDITQHRQTESELARNVEELRIVNDISLAITCGLEMDSLLKTLHEQCNQVAPIDVFFVALYEPSSSLINIPLYYENGKYQVGASRDIHEHPGTIGSIIQARRTLYLHNGGKQITRPLANPESESGKPTKSYIGIPLTVRERIIGVMSIQSYRSNAYSEDQVRLLEQIALQAGIALENARLYAEEQRLAIMDELTHIYNYRGLTELGAREVERSRRFGRPLSALFCDIDGFHDFNNTYSHATGNIVLQAVVQHCRAILRSIDVFARFGGDEFVALLPETDIAGAEAIAKRLAEAIANAKIDTPHGKLCVTMSVGVSMLANDMPDLAALIDRANQAERRVKQNRKSLVEVAL